MLSSEIDLFKGFLEIEERSPHTIRQYLSILRWFEEFLYHFEIDFEDLCENDILKFQLWLKKRRQLESFRKEFKREPTSEELAAFVKEQPAVLSGKSMYKYLTTIRKFLEVNEKQLNWTRIPTPKFDDNFNPDVLTEDEIQKVANVAEKYCTYKHQTVTSQNCEHCVKYRKPKSLKASYQRKYPNVCFYYDGLKLKLMILIAYEAALRTGELCSLKVRHLNLERKEVFIEKPLKHSQAQAIPISDKVTKMLHEYLEKNNLSNRKEHILFPTKTGKKYYPNNFATHVFRPIAKTAGYDVRYYTLRHSRATNLIKKGLDLGWVRRITRHRNINNVLKYIHLSSDDIRKELERKEIF